MKRTPLQRKTPLQSGSRLSRSTPMEKNKAPIKAINVEATKRRVKTRRKSRNDPEWKAENEAAMQLAWERARGFCECGCGRPMDVEGEPHWPGHPEFHHDSYRKGHIRGRYMRRECHQRVETIHYAHRNARRFAA